MNDGTTAPAGADPVEDGQGAEDGTPAEPVLKTDTSVYNDWESVGKALQEAQGALQAKHSEVAELKRSRDQDEINAKLLDRVEQISASTTDADQQREFEAIAQTTRERFAEDPGTTYDFISTVDADLRQTIAEVKSSKSEEVAKQFQDMQDQIAQLKLAQNPVYTQHADKIQEIQDEMGVDQATAIKIVTKLVESTGEIVDTPPGTTGTHVSTSAQGRPKALGADKRAALSAFLGREITDKEAAKAARE